MMRVFVGYDARQPVAFHVAAQSILNHCSVPVSITPLKIETLPITRVGLTPFTYSRFLVPWLCGYQGRAIFMDSDFLARTDIAPLHGTEMSPMSDVGFVPHSGSRRFERASLMVFNNYLLKQLTPEYVQTAKTLHTCEFAQSPCHLDKRWNHLVGYDEPSKDAKMAHFTQGLPCYTQTQNDEFASEWVKVAKQVNSTESWEKLMGHSVHAPFVKQRAGAG